MILPRHGLDANLYGSGTTGGGGGIGSDGVGGGGGVGSPENEGRGWLNIIPSLQVHPHISGARSPHVTMGACPRNLY